MSLSAWDEGAEGEEGGRSGPYREDVNNLVRLAVGSDSRVYLCGTTRQGLNMQPHPSLPHHPHSSPSYGDSSLANPTLTPDNDFLIHGSGPLTDSLSSQTQNRSVWLSHIGHPVFLMSERTSVQYTPTNRLAYTPAHPAACHPPTFLATPFEAFTYLSLYNDHTPTQPNLPLSHILFLHQSLRSRPLPSDFGSELNPASLPPHSSFRNSVCIIGLPRKVVPTLLSPRALGQRTVSHVVL